MYRGLQEEGDWLLNTFTSVLRRLQRFLRNSIKTVMSTVYIYTHIYIHFIKIFIIYKKKQKKMLLKKFSNSDSESFSFIASCLLGFHLFIFIFYSFICSFIHLYVCIYLFCIYLFCLLSPQATSTPLCGLLGDLRDFKASSGTVMLLRFVFSAQKYFEYEDF